MFFGKIVLGINKRPCWRVFYRLLSFYATKLLQCTHADIKVGGNIALGNYIKYPGLFVEKADVTLYRGKGSYSLL
jgi:hypothetical protein